MSFLFKHAIESSRLSYRPSFSASFLMTFSFHFRYWRRCYRDLARDLWFGLYSRAYISKMVTCLAPLYSSSKASGVANHRPTNWLFLLNMREDGRSTSLCCLCRCCQLRFVSPFVLIHQSPPQENEKSFALFLNVAAATTTQNRPQNRLWIIQVMIRKNFAPDSLLLTIYEWGVIRPNFGHNKSVCCTQGKASKETRLFYVPWALIRVLWNAQGLYVLR